MDPDIFGWRLPYGLSRQDVNRALDTIRMGSHGHVFVIENRDLANPLQRCQYALYKKTPGGREFYKQDEPTGHVCYREASGKHFVWIALDTLHSWKGENPVTATQHNTVPSFNDASPVYDDEKEELYLDWYAKQNRWRDGWEGSEMAD